MIVINLTGGLGNQMFQYAFGKYLSSRHKTELKYHFTNALFNTQRSFALDVFNIKASEATDVDLGNFGIFKNRYINRFQYLLDTRWGVKLNKNIVTQRYPYIFENSLRLIPNNKYVQGYFTDEQYFKGIEGTLRRDFTSKNPLDQTSIKLIKKMNEVDSISIHVRRGDLITNSSNAQFLGLNYYINAINNLSKRVDNPHYFVFSDDIPWCKENLSSLAKNINFIDHNKGLGAYKDLILISHCKCNIIANSTFSWWGAWLNEYKNKIIIKP